MHDLKFIRTSPEAFDDSLRRRNLEAQSKAILDLDEKKRALQTQAQELQGKRNELAKQVGQAKAKGEDTGALLEASKKIGDDIPKLEQEAAALEAQLIDMLSRIPNLPADDVPVGKDETCNAEKRVMGIKPDFNFKPKEHFDLGAQLKMMDFDAAAKISGARFVVLKGPLARMERALASFMLDIHTQEFGYTEVVPPYLVRDNAAYGTGQLPKFKNDLFQASFIPEFLVTENYFGKDSITGSRVPTDPDLIKWIEEWSKVGYQIELVIGKRGNVKRMIANPPYVHWLIPTAEVPLTNLVNDTILNEDDLPLRFTAYTPCFRSEAGAAGKDTRGMIRQHQFSKVELVSIVHPDKSQEEHERMTACAEEILKRLGLHYRVITLCTGDMGFSAEKTYDIEVWLPGQNAFREISSCSNCGAFQARRMKARFKPKAGKSNEFVHTLNGSGLAIGRTMIAVMENYQQADGSIAVPEALQPYMGGVKKIA